MGLELKLRLVLLALISGRMGRTNYNGAIRGGRPEIGLVCQNRCRSRGLCAVFRSVRRVVSWGNR